jgi:hypothetical protein
LGKESEAAHFSRRKRAFQTRGLKLRVPFDIALVHVLAVISSEAESKVEKSLL